MLSSLLFNGFNAAGDNTQTFYIDIWVLAGGQFFSNFFFFYIWCSKIIKIVSNGN